MKRYYSLILIITLLLFSFTACGNKRSQNTNSALSTENTLTTASPDTSDSTTHAPEQAAPSTDNAVSGAISELSFTVADMFTKRDKRVEYDDTAVRIFLTGNSATATSDKVQISDNTVTIAEEDTYILSGTLDDGTVIINAADSAKIHLVFDGVNINSSDSAAILILCADKVVITRASEENSLSNGGYFAPVDDLDVNAALYSKEDLSLNGSGSLTINSPAGHGISCKDDLVLAGGTYAITAATHGLDANDSIRLTDSSLSIEAGEDGIHAENSDDTALGFVFIANGTYEINAQDDGIHAGSTLTILDGDINITESYEGMEAFDLVIHGGNIRLVASDDGLNATDPAATSDSDGPAGFGGHGSADNFTDRFKDRFNEAFPDGFHSNPSDHPAGNHNNATTPNQSKGSNPSDGSFGDIFNPQNLPDSFGGSFPGGMSSAHCSITITGGILYLQASGDGIDANGSLTITGGDITICGPNRGDTASLDYDTSGTISGATFIATGATGMAQTLSSSGQGIITVKVGNRDAGTTITLTDSDGNVLLTQTPELPYSLIILSSPNLVSGETYTLTYGTTTKAITAN